LIDIIGIDADDTLWDNETLYARTQERVSQLLEPYNREGRVGEALYETEMRNLRLYGYGIKGFALSMIETAIRVSDSRIQAGEIQQIINLAKEMLDAPVQLLDHVEEVVPALAASCRLILITKGDLRDQETKLAQSGLAPYFQHVEIVRDKTVEIYRALLVKYQIPPERFLMVGNSLRSDVLPVVKLGGLGVHIPYHLTWAHEAVSRDIGAAAGYEELEHIGLLPAYVEGLCRRGM